MVSANVAGGAGGSSRLGIVSDRDGDLYAEYSGRVAKEKKGKEYQKGRKEETKREGRERNAGPLPRQEEKKRDPKGKGKIKW